MRLIEVPVSTIEKPLTAIDYCACLEQCIDTAEVRSFASRCPLDVRQDERFIKAVAARLLQVRKRA